VLRIRVILVRIRIRGAVSLTNGSGSAIFVSDLQEGNKKFCYLFNKRITVNFFFSRYPCKKDEQDVYVPFAMVKSYYEAAGDWTPGREGREFDIALSYSKVCSTVFCPVECNVYFSFFIKIENHHH
jgi:hypothetical protein